MNDYAQKDNSMPITINFVSNSVHIFNTKQYEWLMMRFGDHFTASR